MADHNALVFYDKIGAKESLDTQAEGTGVDKRKGPLRSLSSRNFLRSFSKDHKGSQVFFLLQ